MRIDWYTKGVLTVIAVLLAAIVSKLYEKPPMPVVQAEAPFAGVQHSSFLGDGTKFFDSRTGEIFWYDGGGRLYQKNRLTKLGQPWAKEK